MKTPGKKDGKEKDLLTLENWVAKGASPETTGEISGALLKYHTTTKLLKSTPGVVVVHRFTSVPRNPMNYSSNLCVLTNIELSKDVQ